MLSYHELHDLVHRSVIDALPEHINGASIDVCLGSKLLVERGYFDDEPKVIDLSKREALDFDEVTIGPDGYTLQPGDFVLAETLEMFHLPENIAALFVLKSSMARAGLEHSQAGFCDPGWHGSVLTLELKNISSHHALRIKPGMRIGQMMFFRVAPVPESKGYGVKGAYNRAGSVVATRLEKAA